MDTPMSDRHPAHEALAIRMADATAILGASKSTIYKLAAEGQLRLIKLGRTTLIDGNSARSLLKQLPQVELRSNV